MYVCRHLVKKFGQYFSTKNIFQKNPKNTAHISLEIKIQQKRIYI